MVYEHVRDANMIEPPNKFGAAQSEAAHGTDPKEALLLAVGYVDKI